MNEKKKILAVVLATVCIMSALFAWRAHGAGIWPYNPWWDINDDGIIDVSDVAGVAGAYGTFGQNITKAQVLYDSGWQNITDKQGKSFDVTHNLGISDWNNPNITVEYTGRTTINGPILRSGIVAGFNKTTGNWAGEYILSIVQTSDGGYASTGYIEGYSSGVPNGHRYLTWLKTDSSGDWTKNPIWNIASSRGTVGTSILQMSDGTYRIAGYTNDSRLVAGGYDAWLVYLDSGGNMLMNKTYGGAGDDYAYSMVQTSDGGFALAGSSQSFGGGSDCYLVKIYNWTVQWSKHYGGTNWDQANSIIQTSDGGYALAGYTFSYGAGQDDFYLIKTDASGNMLWNKTYGGPGFDSAYSLVQTSDGGYALAGGAQNLPFGLGGYDFYLVKTDASGNMQRGKMYGGTGDEIANSLIQTSDGGFALAGWTTSFGARGRDCYFVKTDGSGHMQWSKTIGGSDEDEANCLIQAADGGYVMAGYLYWMQYSFAYLVKLGGMPKLCVSCVIYSDNALTFYRDSGDTDWNYLRVQIIKRR